MLAFAQIDGCPDDPPLCLESLGDPVQGREAIDPVIGDDLVVGGDHAPDPPGRASLDPVDVIHDQLQMRRRTVRQGEVRVHPAVRHEEAERLRQLVLDTMEPEGIFILDRAGLTGTGDGHERIALTLEVHVIVHVEGYGLAGGEGYAQRIVPHHGLLLRGTVIRRDDGP